MNEVQLQTEEKIKQEESSAKLQDHQWQQLKMEFQKQQLLRASKIFDTSVNF